MFGRVGGNLGKSGGFRGGRWGKHTRIFPLAGRYFTSLEANLGKRAGREVTTIVRENLAG